MGIPCSSPTPAAPLWRRKKMRGRTQNATRFTCKRHDPVISCLREEFCSDSNAHGDDGEQDDRLQNAGRRKRSEKREDVGKRRRKRRKTMKREGRARETQRLRAREREQEKGSERLRESERERGNNEKKKDWKSERKKARRRDGWRRRATRD